YVLYYLGLTQRGLAIGELAKEAGSPQPVSPNQARAKQLFTDAGKQFAAARQAFVAGVKEPPPDAKELPQELESAARARCDEAEMQLRTLQPKAARDLTAPFLKDPLLSKSRARNLGLYYHGVANFRLQDDLAAGRSLNMLTPFNDPVFGTHARYLLARIHQF